MTAEEFKYGLQSLGWSTEPAELIQFYCSAQRTLGLYKLNQAKISWLRLCHCYIKSLAMYPSHAFAKDFPKIEDDWQADLYDDLVKDTILHSLSEYTEMMLSGRVKNQKFFSALENQYNKPLYQSYCFYVLLLITPEAPLSEAYDQYLRLFAGSDAPLPKDTFQKLFCLMNWRELRDETAIKASAKEANTLLNHLIVSNRTKCEIVAEILPRLGRLKSGDVQAPAAYLAKILYGDSKAYQNVNSAGKIDQIIKQL